MIKEAAASGLSDENENRPGQTTRSVFTWIDRIDEVAVAQILSSLGSKVYNFAFGMKVGGSGEVPAFAGTTGLGLSFIPVFTAVLSGVKNLKFSREINILSGKNPRFFTAFRMTVVGVRDGSGGRSRWQWWAFRGTGLAGGRVYWPPLCAGFRKIYSEYGWCYYGIGFRFL